MKNMAFIEQNKRTSKLYLHKLEILFYNAIYTIFSYLGSGIRNKHPIPQFGQRYVT